MPTIMAHVRTTDEAHIVPRWSIKLTLKQHLFQFILYMKHDNVIMYDAIMWNWNKFVICDDVVFIASSINEAIGNKVWWPS
jgi:hypothetical protein